MSEYERQKGKIKLVEKLPNETLEDVCKRLWHLSNAGVQPNYVEALQDEYYEKFVSINDELWEVTELKDLDCEYEYYNATENADETISFDVMYYNGCLGLGEAIDIAVGSMKKSV